MRPLQIYYPSKDLAPYIQYYIFPEINKELLSKNDFEGLTIFPCTFTSMILFFSEPSYKMVDGKNIQLYNFGLSGFNTSPKKYLRNTTLRQMLVCFTPIGVQPFLNFPLKEITDTHASIKDVFRQHFDMLINELCKAENHQQRIKFFESFFRKKISSKKPMDKRMLPLVNCIFDGHGTKRISTVGKQLNISERTLQRLIERYAGINFKLFSRLVRFRFARLLLSNNPQAKLTEISYLLDYSDQAHFIHDFKKLSGHTPGNFIKTRRLKTDLPLNADNQVDTFV